MWAMLLSAGINPAVEISSTRVGFFVQPETGLNVSSTRVGFLTSVPASAFLSSTRVGFITRSI